MSILKRNFRIGIIGGMGPMTGVFLQKLIIENTSASNDQNHIEVICFTNPHIPDRTKSLSEDNGEKFVQIINDFIKILEKSEVDLILMPCNTAHSKFNDIQKSTKIPILNMIEITLQAIQNSNSINVGLLATDGTISSKIFNSNENVKIILPDSSKQKEIMNIIYEIKSGKYDDIQIALKLNLFVNLLNQQGAEKIILGCTELSLYSSYISNKNIIDPLAELAKTAVKMAS